MLARLLEPDDWKLDGLCAEVDPDLWFPEASEPGISAKRICRRCAVIDVCLEYAIIHHELGIWGGTSERERRALRKEPLDP